MSKKVSILMGIYNCEKYLGAAIESIINQTYDNWEFIICDDGSKDSSYLIAERYAKKYPEKFTLLKNKTNLKLNKTLNRCLDMATGDYIARMDGDDVCKPDRLREEVEFLESHKGYDLVSCQMDLFDGSGVFGKAHFVEGEIGPGELLRGSPFCHAGMMMRAAMMKKLRYKTGRDYIRVEDYDLWYRLYKAGHKGYNLSSTLYAMRDDDSAYARRSWLNRVNEYKVKKRIYHFFDFPWYKRYIIYRPIIVHFIPKYVYTMLRKKRA